MFIYLLGVKLSKFNVLYNPSSSQHYDGSHYSFSCNIESKHFTPEYTFKSLRVRLRTNSQSESENPDRNTDHPLN